YLGNYEDYLRKKAAEEAERAPTVAPAPKTERATKPAPSKPPKPKRNVPDATRLTEEIARFEEEQSKLSAERARPDFYMTHPNPDSLIARYTKVKQQVEDLYRKLDQALAEP